MNFNTNINININTSANMTNPGHFRLTPAFEDFARGGIFTNLPAAEQAAQEAARQLASTQEEMVVLSARGKQIEQELQGAMAQLAVLEGRVAGVEEQAAMLESHRTMLEGAVEHWNLLTMDSLSGGEYERAVYQMGIFDLHRHAHSEWQQTLSAVYDERATLWLGVCAQRQWVLRLQEELRELGLHWSQAIHRAMVLQQELGMAMVLVTEA